MVPQTPPNTPTAKYILKNATKPKDTATRVPTNTATKCGAVCVAHALVKGYNRRPMNGTNDLVGVPVANCAPRKK